jgi:hypothetical protein
MTKYFSFTLIFLFIVATSLGQNVYISSIKLGELRINVPLDSVNKFLETKIKLKPLKNENDFKFDTINTTYKNVLVRLVFQNYYNPETKKQVINLTQIYTNDRKILTKSGIKIGDNKFDIVKKLDGSYLNLSPDLDKGKPYSILVLSDINSSTLMTFYFMDNLLYAISVDIEEGGC